MSRLDRGLAVTSIAIKVAEYTVEIVQAAVEAKHFKKSCRELANDCAHILMLLRRTEDRQIEQLTSQRINDCFQRCRTFTRECIEDWGVLQTSFEVMFRRRHEYLKEELKWVI